MTVMKKNEEKMAECPDDTPPTFIEESVSDRKDDKNENMKRKKRQNDQMKLLLLRWRNV